MIALIDGDVLVYAALWGTENLDESKQRLQEILEGVVENTFSDDYIIAVGGNSNFREEFFYLYKKSPSRLKAKEQKSTWLPELKQHLRDHAYAVTSHGCEADDLVRMWSIQAKEANIPCVIITIDKDLDCIPGLHFNPIKEIAYTVTEDEADEHYWKQILMGDSVDNIPGLPNIGEVKALRILQNCKDSKERQRAVIEAYKKVYNDNWKDYLLSNARLIHIWRKEHDYFKITEDI